MNSKLKMIIAEESLSDTLLIVSHLEEREYQLEWRRAKNQQELLEALRISKWDVIICNYSLPQLNIRRALTFMKDNSIDIPFIIISNSIGEEAAIKVIKEGAHDFILKERLTITLIPSIEKELSQAALRHKHQSVALAHEKKHEFISKVLETVSNPVIMFDQAGKIVYFNEAYEKLTGFSRIKVQGKFIFDLLTSHEEQQKAYDFFKQLKTSNFPHQYENDWLTKSGSQKRFAWSNTIISGEDEQNQFIISTGIDITQSKHPENRLNRFFESELVGVFSWCLSNQFILDANDKFLSILGYTHDELKSKQMKWDEITSPEYRDLDRQALADLKEARVHTPYEKVLIKKDGTRLPVWVGATLLKEGEKNEGLAFVLDITEFKRAEEALKVSEEMFRGIFESNIVGVAFGDGNGKLELANDRYLEIIGYSRSEFDRNQIRWDQITPPEYLHRDELAIQAVQNTGISPPYEKPYIRKDGKWAWVRINLGKIRNSAEKLVAVVEDITEHVRVETQLQSHRELLETILNRLPSAVCLVEGPEFQVKLINPVYQQFAPGKQMTGKTMKEIWKEVWSNLDSVFKHVLETGEPYNSEDAPFMIQRYPDSPLEQTYFNWSLSRIYLPSEDCWGLLNTAWETTARRKIELSFKESESRLRAVLESLPVGVIIANSKAELVQANSMARQIWGQSSELPFSTYQGYKIRKLIRGQEENAEQYLDGALSKVVKSGKAIRDEIIQIEAFDGTTKIVWSNVIPVIGPNEEHYGAVSVLSDITQENQLQEELRRSEEQYSLALEAAGMGTWSWDFESGNILWSERMKEIFGYNPNWTSISFEHSMERIHPEDRNRIQNSIEEALKKTDGKIETEFRVVLPNGSIKWVHIRGRVFDKNAQKPIQITGVVMDITPRKDLELNLQDSLKSRDEMVGIVSHDLKNPLVAIELSAAMLIKADSSKLTKEFVNRRAEIIQQSSSRMLSLISDLLDVTRIEAGRFVIRPTSCPVHSVLQAALRDLKMLVEAKGITIRQNISHSLEESLVGDPERLSQVFGNILGNAIKFTPNQGGRIEIQSEYDENEVRFAISDNGPGIPPEDIPHIFDRFWHSQKSKRAGTGLGLAIAQGIMIAHKGRIWLESTINKGTTFWIAIPHSKSALGLRLLKEFGGKQEEHESKAG